ncbi:MAG: serine/threonine protein kinase [Verrucomicrobiaceae bacterium]|nr:serine/threonine protein kinase [Verrucomicrobiaceae bacterium]
MPDQPSSPSAPDALSGREAGLLGLALVKEDSETVAKGAADSEVASETLMGLFPELAFGGKIGRGGFGTVWRVKHRHLGREMAMKVLAPTFRGDAATLTRFEREMQAAAQVDHPGVVRCFDAGQREGTWFLTMELIQGMSLNRLLEQTGALRVADACEIARQAALALHHAHERGLVHRDVKPGNVMVGAEGVKLLDFGLAQFAAADAGLGGMSLTMSSEFVGTLDYAAPEQVESPSTADLRVDVFSLGATLWHLLAGESPRVDREKESSLLKRLNRIAQQPLADIAAHCAGVSAALAAVLAKMTAHVPADRFSSCAEVAEALEPFCAGHDLKALMAKMPPAEPVEWKWATTRVLNTTRPSRGRGRWWAVAAVLALGAYFGLRQPDGTNATKKSDESKEAASVRDVRENFEWQRVAALKSELPKPTVFRAHVPELNDGSAMSPRSLTLHPRWDDRAWLAVGSGMAWLMKGEQPAAWIRETHADGMAFTADGARMAWTHPGYVSHVDLADLGEARLLAADSAWGDHPLPVKNAGPVELPPAIWSGDASITAQTALVVAERQLFAVSLKDEHAPKVLVEAKAALVDVTLTRHEIVVAVEDEMRLASVQNGVLTPLKLVEPLPPVRGVAADVANGTLYVITDEPAAVFRLMKTGGDVWLAKKLAENFTGRLMRGCVAVSADGKRLVVADEGAVFVWRLE